MIERDLIRDYIEYDPSDPLRPLVWKKSPSQIAKVGDRVGTAGRRPATRFKGKHYLISRLVWLHQTDEPLPALLDHIDRNPGNNRIENLRPADKAKNAANSGTRASNSSGHPGVLKPKGMKNWKAYINIGGKVNDLGTFATKDDAAAAYRAAHVKMHGEFSPYRECV